VNAPSVSPGAEVTAAPNGLSTRPLLTAVVPVYNGGEEIVDNVAAIQRALVTGLPRKELEVIVVSDGSIDDTAERLLAARGEGMRVIHYDRNLGKGYAVKAGVLASHGQWVALVDADLDLDPGSIPQYLDVARDQNLDFAIGSKRHPDSIVRYPRSRRIASWWYQQLNRVLFRLDVRDTQVGLKVFSRRVVDEVVPLLLVKRFAFDLELLAVAAALGYDRVRELPVRLEYRFSGSQLGSRAVARALWDTAAIFYRLRLLRTYQRKRRLLRNSSAVLPDAQPLVSLIGDSGAAAALDYPRLEIAHDPQSAAGELLALLAPGARPAGNWVTAAVPYFSDADVAAVVVPTLTPTSATLRARVAAAVLESRLGGGSRRSRYFPGNVRVVPDQPAETIVIRRPDLLAAGAAAVQPDELVAWLAERGRRTVYTPDASVSLPPPPIVQPHLGATYAHARVRGAVARASRGASVSTATALTLAPAAVAVGGLVLIGTGSAGVRDVGFGLVAAYAAAVLVSTMLAALRFRSARVGLLAAPIFVATHAAYVAGFAHGFVRRG
jgi:glycosyltransferase involved in cell wall biosynthesis